MSGGRALSPVPDCCGCCGSVLVCRRRGGEDLVFTNGLRKRERALSYYYLCCAGYIIGLDVGVREVRSGHLVYIFVL